MLTVAAELDLGGQWYDITSDVRQVEGVDISRGRPDEGSKTDPSSCKLAVNNKDGTYSPRNPESSLYGRIGRNTPIRVWVGTPSAGRGQWSETDSDSHVAPDVSSRAADGLLICGWMGIFTAGNYTVPTSMTADTEQDGTDSTMIAAREAVTSGATGTRTATYSVVSTAWAGVSMVVPGESGAPVLEEHLSAVTSDNTDITLTTASTTKAGMWLLAIHGWSFDSRYDMPSLPGGPAPGSSTPAGTAGDWIPLVDTAWTEEKASNSHPRVQVWIRRVDIDGAQDTVFKADPDDTEFDNHGRVYVLSNVAFHTPRFTGEVSSWPPRWDPTGADVSTPLEASGLLRRLGGVAAPLRSPMYREIQYTFEFLDYPTAVAYWPMEDADGAVQMASAVEGVGPMSIVRAPDLAAHDDFIASEDVPELGTGGFTARVGDYTAGSNTRVQFIMHVPAGGTTDDIVFLSFTTTGTARHWQLRYQNTGAVNIEIHNEVGELVYTSGAISFDINGKPVLGFLDIIETGAGDVDFRLTFAEEDRTWLQFSGTEASKTVGRVDRLWVNGASADFGNTAFGHLAVMDNTHSATSGETGWSTRGFDAWDGERSAGRINRLCHEEYIHLVLTGDYDNSPQVGPQAVDTFLNLAREAADVDLGILSEQRAGLGLSYRVGRSMYNQPVGLSMDYTGGDVSPPLEPTEDDQNLANVVTVKRSGGSSAQAQKTAGPLSTAAPPDGVGIYDTSVTLNLYEDDQVKYQAGWRLHLGTIDRLRYPVVSANLRAQPSLQVSVRALGSGDRMEIVNLPGFLPPGPAGLMVEGFSETVNSFEWTWEGNASPAASHLVAELDSTDFGRLANISELAEALTETETSVDVDVVEGALWTTDTAEFPFHIVVGGETMEVTGISGTASPQTFTVNRSVHGVVKTHDAGESVELVQPMVLAL